MLSLAFVWAVAFGGPVTGRVVVTSTTVRLPDGPSVAAADGSRLFVNAGRAIYAVDTASAPPAVREVARLPEPVTALAIADGRAWVGTIDGDVWLFGGVGGAAWALQGSVRLAPSGDAEAVLHVAAAASRAYAVVAGVGVVCLAAHDAGPTEVARLGAPEVRASLGVVDGVAVVGVGPTGLARFDCAADGPPRAEPITLELAAAAFPHPLWQPDVFAVDRPRGEVVAAGCVVGRAGAPCVDGGPVRLRFDGPHTLREITRGPGHYTRPRAVVRGTAWDFVVSDAVYAVEPRPATTTVTAYPLGDGPASGHTWWTGPLDGVGGVPAAMADGRLALPMGEGGVVVVVPVVGGRVWLPWVGRGST